MSFAHLHVHTVYSIFDGLATIEELFTRAEEIGIDGLAITDHGTMFGVPMFLDVAKRHPSVKPIVGCEIYVTEHDHRIHPKELVSSHLILLAKNLIGYKNLVRIVSEANTVGLNRKPCVSYDYVFSHCEGLVATSACIGGDIPKAILAGNMPRAALLAQKMKKAFGDDFYLEISEHESKKEGYDSDLLEKQRRVTEGILVLSEQLGIKVVATNDVHFCNAEDALVHDAMLCANTNHSMDDPERFIYTGEEYLKSEEQMKAVFPTHLEAVSNTADVLAKIEAFDIFARPSVPDFPLPKESESAFEYLAEIAGKGLVDRGLSDNLEARIRLERELEVIRKMDFELDGACANHYLIVWDLLREMRLRGIDVGPGRGSTAGSLLNYVLCITDINPLEYGLLFERFISLPIANGLVPDIDIDFGRGGIETAYLYLQDKYGYDHVSHVVTFGMRTPMSAVYDVFRAYGLDVKELIDALPENCYRKRNLIDLLNPSLSGEEGRPVREWYRNASAREKEAFNVADRLCGGVRMTGIHACAIVIGKEPLYSYVPLMLSNHPDLGENVLVSQYDGYCIEDCGLERLDLLTLNTLDLIHDASHGQNPLSNLEEPLTIEIFKEGDTQGVFQFESHGMRTHLRSMSPDTFSDLVLLNSTYRPGPMEWIPELIRRKHSGHHSVVLPGTEDILAESYGMLVYQEQVMEIAKKVGGFTPENADRLRKALGKRKRDTLNALKPEFIRGGKENGYRETDLETFWSELEESGMYLFNKAHSVCYTLVAYQCAYIKAHSPAEFYSAALASTRWSRQDIVEDAKAHGIPGYYF